MEVKKIVEGMTAPQVAEVIDSNFRGIKEETDAKLSELGQKANDLENKKATKAELQAEVTRATNAELALRNSINTEVLRAKEAEEELDNRINANRYGYNVTVNGLKGGVHTIETAIKDVPSKFRMLGQKITFRTENGDWATYHNESLSLDNYENVNDWVQEVGISSVTGDINISNNPDYEDLTEAADGTIKFADKEYSSESFSGLGRVYLRKNIIDGVNVLTQDMMSKPNTIYIIQYDYDLQGAEITIPEGCILDFQGGRLSNGILIGNNTTILSENSCFSSISFQGKFCGETKIAWFDIHYDIIYDNSKEICNAFELAKLANKKIIFPSGIIYIDAHLPNSQQYCGFEGKIQLFDSCHIVLQNDTYIKVIPNDYIAYCVFTIANVKYCIIEGGNIVGDIDEHLGTSGEWGYGIGIFGSSNICIRNINISNCWGDGIIFDSFKYKSNQSSFDDIVSTNAIVSNVHIKSCRRNNMAIGAADGVLIENSTFENCGGSKPLYIEGEDWYYASNIDLEADIAGYHKIHNVTFRNITTKVQHRGNSKDRFADIQCQQAINKETGRMNASHIKYENISCERLKLSGYNTSVINSTITEVIDINSAVGFNVSNCQLIGDVIIEGNPNSENGNITNCILNKHINWTQANNKVNVTYCDFVIDDSNAFIGCYLSGDTYPVLSHCKFINTGNPNYTPSCFLHLTFENCEFINFANVYGTFKYGDILKVVYKSSSDIAISLIDSNTPTVVGRRRINIVDNSFEMSRTGDLFTNKDTNYFTPYDVFPIYREFINSAENKNTLKVYFGALKDCSATEQYITLELLGNEFKVDVVERDTSKYNATYTEGKIDNINDIPLIDDYRDKFSYNYKSIVHLFHENAHIKINPVLKRVVEGTIWVQSISNLPSFSDAVKSYMRGLLSYVLDNNCTYRWTGTKWVDATGAEV